MTTSAQRWRDRVAHEAPRARFEPDRHGVEPIDYATARAYVTAHHYSASYPASRLQLGLWRYSGAARIRQLVGVLVYGVPCNESVIPRYAPGCSPREGVELSRLVLADEVELHGESWMLARCTEILRDALPEVRAVVSYSDPCPRLTVGGRSIMPGHVGIIYQASNAIYAGRSSARTLLLTPDARVVSPRTLSKLRTGEVGARYAERQLVAMGCPTRHAGEDAGDYVVRATASLRRLRHAGNHAYVWGLDRNTRRAARAAAAVAPYPKLRDNPRVEGALW